MVEMPEWSDSYRGRRISREQLRRQREGEGEEEGGEEGQREEGSEAEAEAGGGEGEGDEGASSEEGDEGEGDSSDSAAGEGGQRRSLRPPPPLEPRGLPHRLPLPFSPSSGGGVAVAPSLFASSSPAADELRAASIRHQRRLLRSAMNWRIQLQPALTAANSLPPPTPKRGQRETPQSAVEGEEVKGEEVEAEMQLRDARSAALACIDDALDAVQAVAAELIASNPQLQQGMPRWRKRRRSAEPGQGQRGEEDGDARVEAEAGRLSLHLRSSFAAFRAYRNSVLDAWQEKTARAAGHLIGGRGGLEGERRDEDRAADASLLRRPLSLQLEELVRDREALRRRTQVQRGGYRLIGVPPQLDAASSPLTSASHLPDDFDAAPLLSLRGSALRRLLTVPVPHIFDDLDFYSHSLQDVIAAAGASGRPAEEADGGPSSSELLASSASQVRRAMRSAVDRRASKGRKLRFTAISQLQHFMAPNVGGREGWGEGTRGGSTALAVDQLFAHLFGQPSQPSVSPS